jgi:hypothetical protein
LSNSKPPLACSSGADESFARRQLNRIRRRAIEGSAAAVADGCAGSANEGLGPLDRSDDSRRRRVDDRSPIAVDLLGGEDGRGASEEAGDRVGVAGFGPRFLEPPQQTTT